jgi:molybdate transport system substrate-binding protein
LSYPKRLIDAGLADAAGTSDSSTPVPYARGTLVLWTRKDSQLPPPSLDLLRSPLLKRLAIANPERAPYGRAAVAALTSLKIYEELKPRIVTAENIAQTAQFVDSGNADAGLISLTSALTPRLASSGTYFVVPRDLYPPIEQGAVIVSKTSQREAVHKLLDFLLSPTVQAQLAKSGLTPVK